MISEGYYAIVVCKIYLIQDLREQEEEYHLRCIVETGRLDTYDVYASGRLGSTRRLQPPEGILFKFLH